MASSDDEGETLPSVVSDYYFEDNNGEPISFSQLPLKWDDAESLHGNQKEIGLRGIIDNGLLKMFEPVTAWKYDYSYTKPEIMVLTRKNNWIKLLKPRKFFETTIRTILITVHCLNFVKRNPETPGKALWDNLAKVFSLYDPKPSEDDLVDHMNLISEAVKRDEILARSKVLVTFLEDKHRKKKAFHEEAGTTTMSSFIVDDIPDENDENGEDGSDDEGEDFFEHVCAICDNGGKILCCEGKCLRSFHATVEAGEESGCDSLGFSEEQVRAMANQNFECKNCQYKQHQCFVCGELGSSDKSAGAKVFQCVTGTCGYFYHPDCVAKVLRERIGDKAKNLESEIAAGKPFICPIHFCSHCKELEPEDKNELQTQFAICRRCPRAYHRKCLPREIAFEVDEDQGILQRAWENLMPNRILIYCLKHEIDEELATPVRDHIKFPDTDPKKKKQTLDSICKERVVSKKRGLFSDSVPKLLKTFQKSSSALRQVDFSKTNEERSFIRDSSKKLKLAENSEASLKRSFLREDKKSNVVESKASSGKHALINRDFKPVKAARGKISDTEEQTKAGRPVEKEANDSVTLDADSKRRILSIVREAESSITLDEIMKKHKAPSTHGNPSKNVTQTITLGKVEGSIEALNAALQKLEGGGSLEDAKAVCEPGLLNQIMKWKSKLKVYLAPFLYGMRYTSFGRHFTKVDKLQAIVDKLHWYVQDGDMIVDFCCGANDFSVLMKQKMDELKKRCNFKNYDIFPAKNDFNFEKRDWMTVKQNDLPSGSKLIMGLNPPFGVNAALANKFIDKALQFKPKLLILIVPQETLRLDKKRPPYDLVWEDNKLLTGKSFYLPGSVDVNDKQMEDWNVNAPPLYLWSRQDWTTKHKKIAHQQGHLPGVRKTMQLEEFHPVQLQEQGAKVTESYNEVLFYDTGDKESLKDHGCKVEANGNSEEGNKKKRKRGRGSDRKSSERQSLSGHSSPKAGGRSWDSSKHSDMAYHPEVQREGYQHVEQTCVSRSELHTERGYGGYQDVGLARSSSLNIEEPYSDIGNIWQQPVFPVPDYGFRAPDEQFVDRQRDHTNIPGHNAHFGERNEGYGRKADMRALAPFYGHQDPNYRDNYMPTPGLSSSYWQLGPTVDSEYNGMSTSAMQRYAPRLDELNPRMNNMGQLGGIGGMYNTAPGPGSGPLGFNRGPVQQLDGRGGMYNTASGPGPDPSGFAPGPKRPFSQQSSSGWLNE